MKYELFGFPTVELPTSDFCISERFSLVFTQKDFCWGAKPFYGRRGNTPVHMIKGLDDGRCMFPKIDIFSELVRA